MSSWQLTEKHFAILKWVADGCPEHADVRSFKASASLLQARHLLRVRRQPWRAELTDQGRSLLNTRNGGHVPQSSNAAKPPRRRTPAQPSAPTGTSVPPPKQPDLLAEVLAASGRLIIPNPSAATRHRYLAALYRVTQAGALTDGQRMRHTGRDSGDLVFWIEAVDPVAAAKDAARKSRAPVDLPDHVDIPHRLVSRRIKAAQGRGNLPARRLVVVHQLATMLEQRGYAVSGDENAVTATTDDTVSVTLNVADQTDRVPDLDRKGVPKQDYWGKPLYVRVPNGKVQISIGTGYYNVKTWADRKRWTIADKLPEILDWVDADVEDTRAKRIEAERQRRARKIEWEEAVPRAYEAHAHAHNQERASKQLERWAKAQSLRDYANAVREAAQRLPAEQRPQARAWAR